MNGVLTIVDHATGRVTVHRIPSTIHTMKGPAMNLDLHVTITDPPEGFEEYAHAMIHDALPGVLNRRYPFLEGPAIPTITVTTIKDVDAAEKAAPPHHEWIDALTTLDRLANSHPIQQWPDIQAQVRQALDMLSAEFGTLLVGLALGGDL